MPGLARASEGSAQIHVILYPKGKLDSRVRDIRAHGLDLGALRDSQRLEKGFCRSSERAVEQFFKPGV